MSLRISDVTPLEDLDSRGLPTLEVMVTLADGVRAVAGVPSGRRRRRGGVSRALRACGAAGR